MENVDEKFKLRAVSRTHTLSFGDTHATLVATFGSDFQRVVEPFKLEIVDLARRLEGDQHRAAMRMLVDRNGRRPTALEQQLIIAALNELLQERGATTAATSPLDRAAARLTERSNEGWQLPAVQVHQAFHG